MNSAKNLGIEGYSTAIYLCHIYYIIQQRNNCNTNHSDGEL